MDIGTDEFIHVSSPLASSHRGNVDPTQTTTLRLYNSPVGLVDQVGWHFRDDTLRAVHPGGTVSPIFVPFSDTINTWSPDSSNLATLTSEDGITLEVGLTSLNGGVPAAMTGQVVSNTVTYAAPVPSSATDLQLRSTVSGLDLRLILHSAAERGPFVFALAPRSSDRDAQLVTDGSAIKVTRPITSYGDDGTPLVTTSTAFIVQSPIATDSAPGYAHVVTIGPASTTLGAVVSGSQAVTVSIDSSWLSSAQRTFPISIDLPIVTTFANVETGWLGSVNSCAPNVVAPQTNVVVGVDANGCTYDGELAFDTGIFLPSTPILGATLWMYTPYSSGTSGVQVFANAATQSTQPLDPWTLPSWNTAPAIMTGSVGIPENATTGSWHSWNVTRVVQQWVQDRGSNGGLTLSSTGSPALFASPLGAENARVDEAPFLDITYGPASSPSPVDSSAFIYGVAGPLTLCNPSWSACSNYNMNIPFAATAATTPGSSTPGGPGAAYLRLDTPLPCRSNPGGSNPGEAFWDLTYKEMAAAYTATVAASSGHLIPIIQFGPTDHPSTSCLPQNTTDWGDMMKGFMQDMPLCGCLPSTLPWTYFEIGNEPNNTPADYLSGHGFANADWQDNYPLIYAAAAQAIRNNIPPGMSMPSYRIITAGMAQPTADTSSHDCGSTGPVNNYQNLMVAENALADAHNTVYYGSGPVVPWSTMVFGVHPYDYNTADRNYWRNYYGYSPGHIGPASSCEMLDLMLENWINPAYTNIIPAGSYPNGAPVFFTEINTHACPNNPPSYICSSGPQQDPEAEGTYLADLFTYLCDHDMVGSTDQIVPCSHGYSDAGIGRVRVMWFESEDKPNDPSAEGLGLYQASTGGADAPLAGKPVTLTQCSSNSSLLHSLQNQIYYLLRNGMCYP